MSLTEYIREQARVADANSNEWLLKSDGAVQSAYRNGMWYAYHDVEGQVAAMESILRRNLCYLRTDKSRQDYLDACRLCGMEPEDYSENPTDG